MSEDRAQGGQLTENEAVQQFIKLLMENQPDDGRDYSLLLWQMDSMATQLKAAFDELSEVKGQLAQMQESPEKSFISRAMGTVENRLHAVQEGIAGMKERIIEGAKGAVAGVKQTSIKALDKAVTAAGIKKMLEAVQQNLSASITDIRRSIEKVESVGRELRSAGGHLKNVGRAAAGKEMQTVDGGKEGRFQAAVLSPLRLEKDILSRLNNLTLAAIGNVEHLEQAAGNVPDKAKTDTVLDELEPPPDKAEKQKGKPSVLKDLKEKKGQAAAHTAPVPEKERKAQEAAL